MSPLSYAWLLLTVCLIPPGFIIRWHLLSFFFNPLWLIPCQIFVWLKALRKWVLVALIFHFKVVVVYYVFPVYKLLIDRLLCSKGFMKSAVWPEESIDCGYSEEEDELYQFIPGIEWFRIFEGPPLVSEYARIEGVQNVVEETLNTEEQQGVDETWEAEVQEARNELTSMRIEEAMNESARIQDTNQNEMVEENRNSTENEDTEESIDEKVLEAASYQSGRNVVDRISITDSLIFQRGLEVEEEREAVDQFYKEYRERIAQFNRLNEYCTNNLRTILTRLVWNSELPQKFAGLMSVLFDNSESNAFTRKFIKNVRAKIEMFYVGQTCLCSEALQYQYKKIEEIVFSSPPARIPYSKIAARFLHFRILLKRFMEDESMRGERFWNYSKTRHLQYKDLLLVPSLTDQTEADRTGGEKMEPKVLLNIVEECIIAFLKFLENDLKEPSVSLQKFLLGLRKFLLWDEAQVEDANDLKMLSDIKSALRDKEAALKSLQTEKRPSLFKRKRSNRIQDWYKVEYLCCSIDLKLVSRVLAMPLVSTKQLQWCQDVLANIKFDGGRLKRTRVGLLFPCPWSANDGTIDFSISGCVQIANY